MGEALEKGQEVSQLHAIVSDPEQFWTKFKPLDVECWVASRIAFLKDGVTTITLSIPEMYKNDILPNITNAFNIPLRLRLDPGQGAMEDE